MKKMWKFENEFFFLILCTNQSSQKDQLHEANRAITLNPTIL
ncbi:MAG: hypothetical protein ACJAWV_003824 [Flammeovirgaceae bacterium]|jgi:hypothetical protein